MPKIKSLPHEDLCPEGALIENQPDETICEAALRNGIQIEHACEMSAACTTCHCIVRKGFDSLDEASEIEEDLLEGLLRFHLLHLNYQSPYEQYNDRLCMLQTSHMHALFVYHFLEPPHI